VLLLIVVGTYVCSYNAHIGRNNFSFIPYYLKVKPGTNGDGTLSDPPGIVPNGTRSFLDWPFGLTTPGDLGGSGDWIVDWDRSRWTVVGVVDDSPGTPAILAANYTDGHVVYVTNQLAPQHKLVYNIIAWYFPDRGTKRINVAVMIDSTDPATAPEQVLNDWESCFSEFASLSKDRNVLVNVNETRIRQYALNDKDLSKIDLLVFAVGWANGYYSEGWNWDIQKRDDAILRFVKRGGLLVLPEAGLYDEYGIDFGESTSMVIPVRTLQAVLSDQRNSFAMATLSLSAIVLVYTLKGKYSRLDRRYSWIAAYLFVSTIIWMIIPVAGGQLLRQTWLVLMAILIGVAATGLTLEATLRRERLVESPAVTKNPLSDLERLHNLKEKGAITAEEFGKMRATVLGTVSGTQPKTSASPSLGTPDSFCPQCGAEITPSRPKAKPA